MSNQTPLTPEASDTAATSQASNIDVQSPLKTRANQIRRSSKRAFHRLVGVISPDLDGTVSIQRSRGYYRLLRVAADCEHHITVPVSWGVLVWPSLQLLHYLQRQQTTSHLVPISTNIMQVSADASITSLSRHCHLKFSGFESAIIIAICSP